MGHKAVCLTCKIAFSQGTNPDTSRAINCPDCRLQMIYLPHRFRPPKKSDGKKWEVVRFFIEHRFYYQHIYNNSDISVKDYHKRENLVEYPNNMNDAKEFVEKYKSQARKPQ